VWVSNVDATDPEAGIHCGPLAEDLTTKAARIARTLVQLLP